MKKLLNYKHLSKVEKLVCKPLVEFRVLRLSLALPLVRGVTLGQ